MTDLPTPPSQRLDGRIALVTGASSGIGQGCAVALADAGAHVVCAARGTERLNETVEAMTAKGWSAEALPLDLADLDAMEAALERRVFDIVVNAAGTTFPGLAFDTSPEEFDRVISLNLRAAYFLSTTCATALRDAGKPGSIIHISSQMGHVGGRERTLYCASKWGLEGMVRAMALEWAEYDIRVNTIAPTFIRTPLTAPTFARPEQVAWIKDKIKLGRVGEVSDIMGAALYLASDASAMVTGTSMIIDGGWTAD
ncbi:SDR family NAD(P)-dependent oxidoreductase [Phaeobacter sp. 22II1-1F12B]|uniref:SDR family NAD(P)-dependent oxidoreductase n=1 Tax=Phaeobacter sp. 22II1-1F12B TaxID=1317111 RepID=UPI000B524A94|nr:SDR family oxidoreductase [Phaeobacter sp. 22II1-1F12B]OWU80680.1 3-oxoacyl-ACP reductase [Phaeobacter sp. 22II1-1F12B]